MPTSIPDADQILGSTSVAVHEHHSELWAELTIRENALVRAVATGQEFGSHRDEFVSFLRGDVAGHLEAEQTVLYSTARGVGATALVQALDLDHEAIRALIDQMAGASTGLEAAMVGRALVLQFALRIEKEENVLLPMLRRAGVDVEGLLAGKAEITGTGEGR